VACVSFDVVVAADREWGIGKDNGLPWPKLRADLQHFRKITTTTTDELHRNAVVMGRKTWESKEVGGRPLPKRLNVVVSSQKLVVPEGVVVAHTLDEAIRIDVVENIFVVGGAGLLREGLAHPQLRWVYLTRIDASFDCDTRIPDLDAHGFVRIPWDGELATEDNGIRYRIERLHRP
jgi:dihydrofolate reductase